MPKQIRILKDVENDEYVALVDAQEVLFSDMNISVEDVMQVASDTSALCHDSEEDLGVFLIELVEYWANRKKD